MPRTGTTRAPYLTMLVGLLAVALALIVADWAHRNGYAAVSGWRWDTNRDASWIELYRGTLLIISAVLLARLGRSAPGAPVLLAWALLLVVVALDDNLALHERGGGWLDSTVGLPTPVGLTGQDVGELVVWGALGALLAALVVLGHRRSSAPARAVSRHLALALGLVVFFAVVVDMVHAAVVSEVPYRVDYLLTAVEAAGETGAVAVLTVVCVHRARAGLPTREVARAA
ncbi:hypothetical protein [Actinotalea sp. C106]|uniref:hypothetical protein n=1 Tax=Actinotalea sp. C106 TaxID=2908644 RepID=UPI0020293476|nr:hypothetical protein [Actinotalea sp. C106]